MDSSIDTAMTLSDLARDAQGPVVPDLRGRILTVSERLFREIGYRKTTVADIAAELRMSPGNVYRFFPSKKALNEAVAELLLGEIEAELGRISGQPGVEAAQRLHAFITTLHAMTVERFIGSRRMHEMVEVAMAESWEVIQRYTARLDQMLCKLVAEGCAAGEFGVADPMVAARCVHASIVVFCHPALIAQCADEAGPSVDEMAAFVLAGLRTR